jgi:hypothetical protein
VFDDWYIVGEYHGAKERSTMGVPGDIRGRPNEEDLIKVKQHIPGLRARVRS